MQHWIIFLLTWSFADSFPHPRDTNIDPKWVAGCGVSKYPDAGKTPNDANPGNKVIGGVPSRQGEFPWQARLHRPNDWFCGGFLIDDQWVVTAMHCINALDEPSDITVVLQTHVTDGSDGRPLALSKIVRHDDYDTQSMENDICMLKLAEKVTFNEDMKPVCMPKQEDYVDKGVLVTGWGTVADNNTYATSLRHVNVTVITNAECQQITGNDVVFDSNICFIGLGDGKDAGNGDSGGAVVYKDGNTFRAVGIVSWGYTPSGQNAGVNTRVSSFLDWIQNVRDTE